MTDYQPSREAMRMTRFYAPDGLAWAELFDSYLSQGMDKTLALLTASDVLFERYQSGEAAYPQCDCPFCDAEATR